jgi:hypothetical protein
MSFLTFAGMNQLPVKNHLPVICQAYRIATTAAIGNGSPAVQPFASAGQ